MDLGLDLFGSEDLRDDAVLIDEVGGAEDADGVTTTGHFLAPAAELLKKLGVNVGYERELEVVCISKLLLQLYAVLAHSDDGIAFCLQLCLVLLKGASLSGASAGVCLRIGIKYNLAALVITGLNLFPVLVDAKNFGYTITYVHN